MLNSLSGYRTYIAVALAVVAAGLGALGYISPSLSQLIVTFLLGGGVAGARSAAGKAASSVKG